MKTCVGRFSCLALLATVSLNASERGVAAEKQRPSASDQDIAFFEKKIRPVLIEHCYQCHSRKSKTLQGGLLLDSRAGLLQGGDSGQAIVPGKAAKSLLISALRYEDLEMPPKGKLPDSVVNDFVQWIQRGAPDPRDADPPPPNATSSINIEAARKFWAYQPPQRRQPPDVNRQDWPAGEIDRFVLARLEKRGLSPVSDADRRTLIRRLTFDLTGLPPTPAEIDAFVHDESDGALQSVVDRLLASQHFGEHWGRHWLDVARYADSNGGDINLTYHNAWRYRDYVVAAFNNDKPFDRFIVEQIAGDLLDCQNDEQRAVQLIATGLLVIGPKMLSERNKEKLAMDVVDEQIDTLGRVFLGLTLGCARCHDHKFDPIPTRDYYALAGIFRSTITVQGIRMNNVNVSGWIERPLPMPQAQELALAVYKQKADGLEQQIAQAKSKLAKLQKQTTPAAESLPGVVVDDVDAVLVGAWLNSTHVDRYVGDGYVHDGNLDKGQKSITFTPDLPQSGIYEVRISYASSRGRSDKVPVTIRHTDGIQHVTVNQEPLPPIDSLFIPLGRFQFKAGKHGSVTISTDGTKRHVIADAAQFIPIEQLDGKQLASPGPTSAEVATIAEVTAQLKRLESSLSKLKKSAPAPARMAMAAQDRPEPSDCQIRIRGNPNSQGEVVPRGFLTVIPTAAESSISQGQSGRAEIARWIADPDNPLTARVFVNRVWHHLFGGGIVRSVDNFGRQGDRPSHPQLLDWLALKFIDDGWSVKNTIKRIVLSRTYRLSTRLDAVAQKLDPQNRLLWSHNRRRLTAEAIRDAILAAGGSLDRTVGGSAVSGLGEQAIANNLKDKTGLLSHERNPRRSIYLPLVRNDTPDILTVFDFADPDVAVGARSITTVPAQALLMLNGEFVKSHARHLAQRVLQARGLDDRQRVGRIYELTLGRSPSDTERTRALDYIETYVTAGAAAAALPAPEQAWASFCHAVLASTEFRFID